MDGQNSTKFCIHIIIDKIYIDIVKHFFWQMFNRVTALNWCQKLVFAQYLEIGWTEFNQILYTLYHWHDLCLYCKLSFFANLQPWLMSEIGFCSISWEWMSAEFNQILYTHDHRQDLYWYRKASFWQMSNRVTALDWYQKFFCLISWEWMDRIQPNFVYTLSLTRSMMVK